jgi:glyoxylase-like metal-dependent hydrolase (beta-lactamase superfamily II)
MRLLALFLAAVCLQAQDQKTVTIQTLNVKDILYVLSGGGGNSLALMRDDGVVLIDTKQFGWGRPLLEAIGAVSDQPVKIIVNTNADPDHSGGNAEIPGSPRIIAHQKTKAYLEARGVNPKFLPTETVTDKLSLLDGPDRMEIYYFGRAHTDGDLVVVFPEKHVAYLGDLFPSKAAPVIDVDHGGSAVEFPRTLARVIAEIKGVARVITGHDQGTVNPLDRGYYNNPKTSRWSDVQEYADFNRDFLAAIQEAMQSGKTAEQAAATLRLPEKYKGYDMSQAKSNVESIYAESKFRAR